MENQIAISTGLVYKFYPDQVSRIQRMKPLFEGGYGVEICIADPALLLSFDPDETLIEYIKTLPYVSIHAPWIGMTYGDNELCHSVLLKLQYLSGILNAKHIIVHSGWTKNYDIFRKYGLKILVENEDYKLPESWTPDQIAQILQKNPDIGFNFDFAHALTIWADTVRSFIDRFESQIVQVHMSHLSRDVRDHNFLYRDAEPWVLELLQYFKERIKAPLVLENVAQTEEEIDMIREEITFLRNF